ncbi:putative thiazole-containing bacteriocin maturation protein [Paenibacillus thalictri]|uniref:Putative thiazole-containing bacteriocin maturation protein n=1 Tax=Paenibacillus thalictri TaxID=2527873 RepID=A0A4Q9DM74_9BACL|nr:putative thiazole-containing bacteriocin maturation protein [Paenibacillus thalictri]TBL75708.1 putative thiazole-containing bacteriocin maturation protein [Paenibacillus thalictri]
MAPLSSTARPKIKGDTFYLPLPGDGVYFRNNTGTFRMEGEMVNRWIEKLIPMFNGEYTLADLTDGLPDLYRDRVYEIAEQLHQKGVVRDASQDSTHRLPEEIVRKYGGQIAFLDSFGGSGAYRFQSYRQMNVLAVGSGSIFTALVSALLESGLPRIRTRITDSVPTNRRRLAELAEQARESDPEVALEEIAASQASGDDWRTMVQPVQAVLYVSENGDLQELRQLHAICRQENKLLIPAICVHQTGLIGPILQAETETDWESAWRRIHRSAVEKDPKSHVYSSTAGAMLANVAVFELFKTVTDTREPALNNAVFLLDLETLEGTWHSVLAHPQLDRRESAAAKTEWTADVDSILERDSAIGTANGLFPYFGRMTSPLTGVFHLWEEGSLLQLPLSQCRVQAADPLSGGPAELLPDIVCSGLTHEEARREAGLAGLEAYVSRWADVVLKLDQLQARGHPIGIGAGETAAEGIARALQSCLYKKFVERQTVRRPLIVRVQLGQTDDERCRYYMQALTVMRGAPVIGLGEDVCGFPVIWVGVGDRWYGSVGLNRTLALRRSLQGALLRAQNAADCQGTNALEVSSILLEKTAPLGLTIPSVDVTDQKTLVTASREILQRNGMQVYAADLAVEPFLQETVKGVFGVQLREGGSR